MKPKPIAKYKSKDAKATDASAIPENESTKSSTEKIDYKTSKQMAAEDKIDGVKIRMYCIGTGDCFIISFLSGSKVRYNMMVDCGSCQGEPKDFRPYIEDLAKYVDNHINLLVVTHEHQDHVNGFAKCADLFKGITFDEAWFAWTENPDDPDGAAGKLRKGKEKIRKALSNAATEIAKRKSTAKEAQELQGLADGLKGLAAVNAEDGGSAPLAGMTAIKDILGKKNVQQLYLNPGEIKKPAGLKGVKFYVLGPPADPNQVYKDGKGDDTYKNNPKKPKALTLDGDNLAVNALLSLSATTGKKDLPFDKEYLSKSSTSKVRYDAEPWRNIDNEWLNSSGALALRLNSHINNTSLALAIEFDSSKKVLLFPGDAEYGNWESWHNIEKWQTAGKNKKTMAEDLLNRTVFYKVGHHLSYNGTAKDKGVKMMQSEDLTAMVTLDRTIISSQWKSTMPNVELMQDLMQRTKAKVFVMNEADIANAPSKTKSSGSNKGYAEKKHPDKAKADQGYFLYKEYTISGL